MAIKFLLVALFFALAVIKPVHDTHEEKDIPDDRHKNHTRRDDFSTLVTMAGDYEAYTDYLWMYLVFVYLFTAFLLYLVVSETRKIIEIRQKYLGSQTTITDRTIRLSGIPLELRSETKIKEFIEDLEIGQVESVTLCKNWKELDERVVERQVVLRKLEEAWTVYLGNRRVERSLETLPVVQPQPPAPEVRSEHDQEEGYEASPLLNDTDRDPDYTIPYARPRPMAKIWFGRFNLRFNNVDAINYYEEKLRRLDDTIKGLRQKDFEPTPLAFVTMDSVASAQMAIQAVLDPSPLQLLANSSPAPPDVVWTNTYMSRNRRMLRAWSITALIGLLTVFWTALLVPIAGALNTCAINEVFPGLAALLDDHEVLQSLVNTQLPTLAITLLNVLVPFLYDCRCNDCPITAILADNSRAGESTGYDLPRRRGIKCHIQELLLRLFQLLLRVHYFGNGIRVSCFAGTLRREASRCVHNRKYTGKVASSSSRLLYKLHRITGPRFVPTPSYGVWCPLVIPYQSYWSKDTSRYVVMRI